MTNKTTIPRILSAVNLLRALVPIIAVTGISTATSAAADITGTITVKQRLTRPSVTAPVSLYERGPAVELGRDSESDPLAYERARVVVYVEAVHEKSITPRVSARPSVRDDTSAVMEQVNRRFEPDVVVIPVGSSVRFPNIDPIFHNVFSLSKPKSFDLGNYPRGDSRTVTFPKAGIVYVNCRLHTNMAGVIVVAPNQWYTKVGRDGLFALHDLPPGTYTVAVWHKSAGFVRKEVEVVEGHDTPINFLVPLEGNTEGADPDMGHMKMASR